MDVQFAAMALARLFPSGISVQQYSDALAMAERFSNVLREATAEIVGDIADDAAASHIVAIETDAASSMTPASFWGSTCSVKGCTSAARAKGLCSKHYQAARRRTVKPKTKTKTAKK